MNLPRPNTLKLRNPTWLALRSVPRSLYLRPRQAWSYFRACRRVTILIHETIQMEALLAGFRRERDR